MLLPYHIATLNIEHAYFAQSGRYEGFEGSPVVNTLDSAEHHQTQLGFMTPKS
jgi:predicted helicase